jgi:folate-binding protein YgfZ
MFSPDQYRAVRREAGLVVRSDRGRIRLTGPDRRSYLQGLLTNDIVALDAGAGCYACLLTAQGRMIADMYVIETGEAIVMDVEPFVGALVAEHLERFVFSEDVVVENITATVAQLGVFGPQAAAAVARAVAADDAALAGRLVSLPVLGNWRGDDVVVVRRDDLGGAGFDVFVDADKAASVSDALRRAGAVDVSRETADCCRIEAGRPVFGQDMTEETIPLEAGIEDRAISQTKGCYVGQEIIIRVLHRGQGRVAKRLVGLTLDATAAVPQRGTRISAGDRDVGIVTSAVRSPALDHPIALGYVHRDFVEPETALTIGSSSAVVTTLPFVTFPD